MAVPKKTPPAKRDPDTFRSSKMLPLQTLLMQALGELQESTAFRQQMVRYIWNKTMGHTIAVRTSYLALKGRKLYLTIESGPLRQELALSKDQVKKRLNEELGTEMIEEVIVR